MDKIKQDKTLRISARTHSDLAELHYKTKESMKNLTEEAILNLKLKRLKGAKNDKLSMAKSRIQKDKKY